MSSLPPDVPMTMDFRIPEVATEWADKAMELRPWRALFFDTFVQSVAQISQGRPWRVLELGSGPGFLAQRLLQSLPRIAYVAADFSLGMLGATPRTVGSRQGP